MAFVPAKDHQVEFSISSVNKIACVPETVELGKLSPFGRVGLIAEHEMIYELDVDVVGGEGFVQGADKVGQCGACRSILQWFLDSGECLGELAEVMVPVQFAAGDFITAVVVGGVLDQHH